MDDLFAFFYNAPLFAFFYNAQHIDAYDHFQISY